MNPIVQRSRARWVAPWVASSLALGGMVVLTAIYGGPTGYFGPVAALLDTPLFTLWFLSTLVLAVRALPSAEHERPIRARLVRSAALAVAGLALAAPVIWRRMSIDDQWFGLTKETPNRPLTVFFQALFLAGEVLIAVAMSYGLFGRNWLAFRRTVAAILSFVLFCFSSLIPIRWGLLLAFIGSVTALIVSRLTALEGRFPRRVRLIRLAALAIAAALMLRVGVPLAINPRDPALGDLTTPLGRALYFAGVGMFLAGGLLGYSVLAFAASDLMGTLTGPFRSVRTRMVALAIVAAGVGFALRDLNLDFDSGSGGEVEPWFREVVNTAFNLAATCLFVWIFAVAMARRLSRSLEQSVAALGAIRKGDLSVSLPETGNDELTEVGRTFNEMVAQLREAEFLERINSSLQSRSGELQRTLQALRSAQAELVRAERMASVATLVRGIAHELNNPIGFISGNVPLLRKYCDFLARAASALSDGKPRSAEELRALTQLSPKKDLQFVIGDLARMNDDISEGARRARLIITDLQSLTAASQRGVEQVDLHRVVRQSLALLAPRLTPAIKAETELAPVRLLAARSGQLEQVLVNLLDNAIRAVEPAGTIRILLGQDGSDVRLSVIDSGCGMTEEVRRQACEPFFTTRAPGEGSGLGLAIVASIVRGHHGTLDISSAPGQGTDITIRLPAIADAAMLAELPVLNPPLDVVAS